MNTQHTHRNRLAVVVALGVALLASGSAPGAAAASHNAVAGAKMTAGELRALHARNVELNRHYRLGEFAPRAAAARRLSPSEYHALTARSIALNQRYGTAASRMAAADFRALYLRGVALNRLYRLGDYAPMTVPPPEATTGDGVDWVYPAIAVAAALGLAILVAVAALGHGRGHGPPVHSR